MAEGRDNSYLSPLEEQYIREAEADGDLDQQLLRERELAAQRLWLAFQDSATAVAHLFRGMVNLTMIFGEGGKCVCHWLMKRRVIEIVESFPSYVCVCVCAEL